MAGAVAVIFGRSFFFFVMGKGLGLIGNFTGKVGNVVGYNIRNSSTKATQGIRAYQPSVRNPRSYAQTLRRLRFKPVNNFARALRGIIERGFEGVPYGSRSRSKFLSLALSNFSGPYLVKGDNTAVPGGFTISDGSLLPVSVLQDNPTGVTSSYTSLVLPSASVGSNLAELSTMIIANNAGFAVGDQLTFVQCFQLASGLIYRSASVYLTSDTSIPVPSVAAGGVSFATHALPGSETIVLTFTTGDDAFVGADNYAVAAAVIHSRLGAGGVHLRSRAVMKIYSRYLDSYFDESALERAIASYMTAGANPDWPEELVPSGESPVSDFSVLLDATYVTSPSIPAGVSVPVLAYVTSQGQQGFYYVMSGDSKQFVTPGRAPLTYTVEGTVTPVLINEGAVVASGIALYAL